MRNLLVLISLCALAPPALADSMALSANALQDVTAAIQAHGFNCPAARMAYAKGPDAIGDVVKILCGPEEGDGVFADLAFRVTFRPDGSTAIEPWQ